MFETRFKTTLTLLVLTLALAISFLIAPPVSRAAAVSAPDFTISSTPTSQTIERGGTAVYNIQIGAVNGFTGTVTLTDIDPFSKTVPSFSSTTVTGSGDVQFSVFSNGHQTPIGTATLTVTGTSGNLQHSVQVTLTVIPVPDFSLSINTSLQTVKPGTTAAYLIHASVVSGSGFTGSVTFTVASGLPANSTASFTAGSVVVPGDTELDIHTTAQTPVGSFSLIVTGTSGSLSHSLFPVLEVIPPTSDFSMSATPTSQSIQQGGGAIYTVHIGAINGFNGTVNFTLAGLPPLTDTAFGGSGTVTGSGDQTIFLFTSTGVTGTFTLTITGTSGPLQHMVQVTLTLTK
jgi:hypothetical protein